MAPSTLDAVVSLRGALDAIADALAGARLDGLLDAETALVRALDRLHATGAGGTDPRVAEEVRLARAALLRCRRLGGVLSETTRLSLESMTGSAYSRAGASPVPARASSIRARG